MRIGEEKGSREFWERLESYGEHKSSLVNTHRVRVEVRLSHD
jgi:hypothetical protein